MLLANGLSQQFEGNTLTKFHKLANAPLYNDAQFVSHFTENHHMLKSSERFYRGHKIARHSRDRIVYTKSNMILEISIYFGI